MNSTTRPIETNEIDRWSTTGIFAFPPEILSAIFERGKEIVDIDPRYGEGRTPPDKSFEWLVSQSCPVFREVALATPTLWTSLQFNGTCPLSWIQECISRSGSCLLDLLIEDGYKPEEGQEHWLDDAAVATIINHSLRWRSLSLTCAYASEQTRIVSRICDAPAPFLRHLWLQVTRMENIDHNAIDDMRNPHIFRIGAPILSFLRLGDWAMCLFRPPLDSIVTLHFDNTGRKKILYSTFRGMITSSPFLEHLWVNGDIIGRDVWPRREDVVVLPKLRSLRICGIDGGVYSGILLGFDTPLLQSLTLKDMHNDDLDELWELNDKSRYSNLTHLVFHDFDLSYSTYKRLFKTFTEITSFSNPYNCFWIEMSPVIDFLSGGIVVGQEPPYFPWPKLRDLEFNFKDTDEEEEIICDLVDHCIARGCPLSSINLRVSEDGEEELIPVEVTPPTLCRFVTKDELWPPNRSFIDYYDTANE